MGKVIGNIIRDKPAKGLAFLVKYSDLETCLADRTPEAIYLHARFSHSQSYRKETRDRLKDEGRFHIVGFGYHPDGRVYGWQPPESVKNPVVISAEISSLPAVVAAETHISRAIVRNILCERISKLTHGGFDRTSWFIRLSLLAKNREIECVTGGLEIRYQSGPDAIEIIPLETDKELPEP